MVPAYSLDHLIIVIVVEAVVVEVANPEAAFAAAYRSPSHRNNVPPEQVMDDVLDGACSAGFDAIRVIEPSCRGVVALGAVEVKADVGASGVRGLLLGSLRGHRTGDRADASGGVGSVDHGSRASDVDHGEVGHRSHVGHGCAVDTVALRAQHPNKGVPSPSAVRLHVLVRVDNLNTLSAGCTAPSAIQRPRVVDEPCGAWQLVAQLCALRCRSRRCLVHDDVDERSAGRGTADVHILQNQGSRRAGLLYRQCLGEEVAIGRCPDIPGLVLSPGACPPMLTFDACGTRCDRQLCGVVGVISESSPV